MHKVRSSMTMTCVDLHRLKFYYLGCPIMIYTWTLENEQ